VELEGDQAGAGRDGQGPGLGVAAVGHHGLDVHRRRRKRRPAVEGGPGVGAHPQYPLLILGKGQGGVAGQAVAEI